MATEPDLTSRGIAAYEAGDRKEAAELLSQAVKENRDDERAWHTLSKVLTNPEKRKHCLQMVLRINPENAEARTELEAVEGDLQQQSKNADDLRAAASTGTGGVNLKLLSAIPGAPDSLALSDLTGAAVEITQKGFSALTGQADPTEETATWWKFWAAVGTISFINGLLFVIGNIIFSLRFSISPSVPGIITVPFLAVLIGGAAVAAGCYLSHWYANRQENGTGGLLEHSYTLAIIWAPAALITGLLAALENSFTGSVLTLNRFLRTGIPTLPAEALIVTLVALVVTGLALFRMAGAIEKLHGISNRAAWVTAAIMLAATALIFR
jgi:hypothetical protein